MTVNSTTYKISTRLQSQQKWWIISFLSVSSLTVTSFCVTCQNKFCPLPMIAIVELRQHNASPIHWKEVKKPFCFQFLQPTRTIISNVWQKSLAISSQKFYYQTHIQLFLHLDFFQIFSWHPLTSGRGIELKIWLPVGFCQFWT